MELLVIGFIAGVTAVLLIGLFREARIQYRMRKAARFEAAVSAEVISRLTPDDWGIVDHMSWSEKKMFTPIKHP